MIISIHNKKPHFSIAAPPSKSIYHRELIVRFLCGDYQHLSPLDSDNEDVIATKSVLKALYTATHTGDRDDSLYHPEYITENGTGLILPCNESGSTLRFMIPVAAAYILGASCHNHITHLIFETKGRLYDRPLRELEDALAPHGITLDRDEATRSIIVSGTMTPGDYTIDGSVSSQYISGLLMALTIFEDRSTINIVGDLKSIHYIELTQDVLEKYGCPAHYLDNTYYPTASGYNNHTELETFDVEGDWSNGAFLLCLKEWLDIDVTNLREDSRQGDRAILDYLKLVDSDSHPDEVCWDCSDIPDITPYMAIVAPFVFKCVTFTGIDRLRIKESDRVTAVREQLAAAGILSEESDNTLTIHKYTAATELTSPLRLSSYSDHRMAMCAMLLGVILNVDIEIDDINCLRKSFPELLDYIYKYF